MSIRLLWVALPILTLPGAADETAVPDGVDKIAVEQPGATEPRGLFEIHKELRELLRDEAVGKDRKAWELTVVKLTELYGQITRDQRPPGVAGALSE